MMIREIAYPLRVFWACARKDFQAALTDRLFTILGLFVPANVLILMSLFVLSGGKAPTAVVMQEGGPYAQAFYQAMSQAHSFRLQVSSAAEAERLMAAGQVVAVVTIPADFDAGIQEKLPVPVDVEINNLNTDFTNDIRRAIPLSITSFYAKAFPDLVSVTTRETDLYPQDTDYIPYLAVSILVIALMIGGMLQAGIASAKGFQSYDVAIRDLEATLAARRSTLHTATIRAVEQSLAIIDRAIHQAEAALAQDPNNMYLNNHLAHALDRKLEVLRRVTSMAAAS
jgi:ABC-2 type transport system permease protein